MLSRKVAALTLGGVVLRFRFLLSPLIAAVVALGLAALSVYSPSSNYAQAGVNGANSLAISPVDKEIGVGATASVELVSMPPAESLAVWVIEVAFDPAVVTFNSCASVPIPAGALGVTACEAKDAGGSPDDDTVVSLGAIIFPATGRGLDDETILATITFDAVGAVGECSDLTINVVSHLGPDPSDPETNPTTTDGEICIVAPCQDLNGDGKVTGRDVAVVARAMPSQPGHKRWNPDADLNNDNVVDLDDLKSILASLHDPDCGGP